MKRQEKTFKQATSKKLRLINAVVIALMVTFTWSGLAQAAAAKKNTKATRATRVSKSHKKEVRSPNAARTPVSTTVRGSLDHIRPIKILSFKKKVAPGTMLSTRSIGGTSSGASNLPGSTTINDGESITLSWRIKACESSNVTAVYFQGGNVGTGTGTTSGGCQFYSGERTVTPPSTRTYTLRVVGQTEGGTHYETTRRFKVKVAVPHVDIYRPDVNQDSLSVAVSVRNTGMVEIGPGPLTVDYEINAPTRSGSMTPIRGSFTTSSMTIARGARADLGSFSLADHRERLMAHDRCHILLTVKDASGDTIDDEGHTHRWTDKTFSIDNTLMPLLSAMSSYDIRLNNYGGGVHPRVHNDCRISVNLMGGEFAHNFDLAPQVEDILLAIAPSPIPIMQPVAIYVNQITASRSGAANLLSVQNGKLVIHVEFPNSGSRELKLGFHNFGRHDEFRDNPVADVELNPFSVDIRITPELRDGRISYGAVEVDADGVSGSFVGSLDGALNAFVGDYLNDTLESILVDYLAEVLNGDTLRTSFENGIAEAIAGTGVEMSQILEVRGSGNTITVTYR